MASQNNGVPQNKVIENNVAKNATPQGGASWEARLEEPEARPRRNPILHWISVVLSLISLKVSAVRTDIKTFLQKKVHFSKKLRKNGKNTSKSALPQGGVSLEARLEELEARPRRNPILHWVAFALSLISVVLLSSWAFSSHGPVPTTWVIFDIGLGVVTAVELFTRSGFKWNRGSYMATHFFDFVAIIPALALVNHGIAIELVWVGIILVARFVRVIDRLGGDGFVQRNIWALVEGCEEEITDRVLQRIILRVQADLDRAHFSHEVAAALVRNKSSVLRRVRTATPTHGFIPILAHIVGLDKALERAEERTYDAVVEIIDSEEIDTAVRDVVNSVFSRMHSELGEKSWKQNIGIRHHTVK